MKIGYVCFMGALAMAASAGAQQTAVMRPDSAAKLDQGHGVQSRPAQKMSRKVSTDTSGRDSVKKRLMKPMHRRVHMTSNTRVNRPLASAWTGVRNAQALGDSGMIRSAWQNLEATYHSQGKTMPADWRNSTSNSWPEERFRNEPVAPRRRSTGQAMHGTMRDSMMNNHMDKRAMSDSMMNNHMGKRAMSDSMRGHMMMRRRMMTRDSAGWMRDSIGMMQHMRDSLGRPKMPPRP